MPFITLDHLVADSISQPSEYILSVSGSQYEPGS